MTLSTKQAPAVASEGVDYMVVIEDLREQLESDMSGLRDRLNKVEDSQGKTDFRSQTNESRVDKLEAETKDMNSKLMNLAKESKNYKANFGELDKKISELKNSMNEKIDSDIFDQEINCKYSF